MPDAVRQQKKLSDLLDFPRFTPDEVRLLSLEERQAFIDMHCVRSGRGVSAQGFAVQNDLREAIVAQRLAVERVAALHARHADLCARNLALPLPTALAIDNGEAR